MTSTGRIRKKNNGATIIMADKTKKKKKKIVVEVCTTDGDIFARYQGRWGVLEGNAMMKARRLVDKTPDRDIGSATPMREYGSIEINENDFVPMP